MATRARKKFLPRHIVKPDILLERLIAVGERVRAEGTVEAAPDPAAFRRDLEGARADGIEATAIVFMHSYHYPDHERQVASLAREVGFLQVSVSHEVSRLIKLVGRGDTTVVDAYLSPILRRYVAGVAEELSSGRQTADGRGQTPEPPVPSSVFRHPTSVPSLMFMMSSGGLTAADMFQGTDAILSGPAGGVGRRGPTGREPSVA